MRSSIFFRVPRLFFPYSVEENGGVLCSLIGLIFLATCNNKLYSSKEEVHCNAHLKGPIIFFGHVVYKRQRLSYVTGFKDKNAKQIYIHVDIFMGLIKEP